MSFLAPNISYIKVFYVSIVNIKFILVTILFSQYTFLKSLSIVSPTM